MDLLKQLKITRVKAGQSSAGTEVDSDSVDMAGFDGVIFIGSIATANAGNYMKVQGSDDNSTFSDLEGTKVVPGDDGDQAKIEIHRPRHRYLRAVIIRAGANTATGDIYAIQHSTSKAPITNDDAETHISPAAGTA